jgi:hypothetical protein
MEEAGGVEETENGTVEAPTDLKRNRLRLVVGLVVERPLRYLCFSSVHCVISASICTQIFLCCITRSSLLALAPRHFSLSPCSRTCSWMGLVSIEFGLDRFIAPAVYLFV